MTQTGGNKQGRKWLQCFLPTKYIFQINIAKGHMRIHWNVSFIKSIFINLSNSMSLFWMFCCYPKFKCLHVVCLIFIFKLHCLTASITNAVQIIFTKTSAAFLTNPFTFSKFLLFCFVIRLSNYWFECNKNISYDQILLLQHTGDLLRFLKHFSKQQRYSVVFL